MGGPGSGGSNRIPTAMHILKGSYRKDRHGPRPPGFTVPPSVFARCKVPEPPKSLDDETAAVYEVMRGVLNQRVSRWPKREEVAMFTLCWCAMQDAYAYEGEPGNTFAEALRAIWSPLPDKWGMTPGEYQAFLDPACKAYGDDEAEVDAKAEVEAAP